MPSELVFEIIIIILFLAVILNLFREKKEKEILFLLLPWILYDFFLEAMGVHALRFLYSDRFHLLIFGVPLLIPMGFSVIIYFVLSLTNIICSWLKRIFQNYTLSLFDAILVFLVALLLDPLAKKLGFWSFPDGGYYFGIPNLNFIGWFLFVFIFSFGYRTFKKYNFKKRVFLTYGYIFLILSVKYTFDLLFVFK